MKAHFQCADPEDPGKNQCYNGKRQIQVQKFFNFKISTKRKQSKTILMDKTGVEKETLVTRYKFTFAVCRGVLLSIIA